MADRSAAENERRQRWAYDENQRRMAHFQRALGEWSHDDQHLAWMQTVVRNGVEGAQPASSEFVGRRGEELLGTFGDCRLLEVKRGAGTYRGGSSGFSFRIARAITYRVGGSKGSYIPGAEELRIAGDGSAYVSSDRVVFQGGMKSREWTYAKLLGISHDPERPVTMIHVGNRQNASGIAYPVESAPQFRFLLELAVARATGRVAPLIASLDAQRAEHARWRPAPSAPVTPEQAPPQSHGASAPGVGRSASAARRPDRRRRILNTALVGGVALLLVGGVANAMSPSGATEPAVLPAPTVTVTTTVTPTPEETPTPEATETPTPDETASSTPSETPSAAATDAPSETPTAAAVPPPVQSPSTTPSPVLLDDVVRKVRVGAKPKAPTYLRTNFPKVRTGAVCRDGSHSDATGRGACSWHGGVLRWTLGDSDKATENKWTNSARKAKYKSALKRWNARKAHNAVLAAYPCSKGPYEEGSAGYRSWRDTNDDGLACA